MKQMHKLVQTSNSAVIEYDVFCYYFLKNWTEYLYEMDFNKSTGAHDLKLNSVYVLVIENTGLLPFAVI